MTIFDIHTQQLKTSIHLFKGEVAIERAETKALLNWICSSESITQDEDKVILLSGTAGQGKTVVLQNLLEELKKNGQHPVYALKADQLDFGQINGDDFIMQYVDEFSTLSEKGLYPILIIDQIDALSKSLSADRKPISLLDSLLSAVSTVEKARIIVSCRPYDLDFDPLLSKYKYKKKLGLTNLTYEQVKSVLEHFGRRIPSAESKMAEFLSTPINLELFLEYGKDDCEVVSLQSLMDELWYSKITDAASKNEQVTAERLLKCLEGVVDAMDRNSSLTCSKKRLEQTYAKEISYLVSENILLVSADNDYLSFIHQTLADYVSARIVAETNQTMATLLKSRHQGLYVRNRVKQYFTYLREAKPETYIHELKDIVVDDRKGAYRMHIKMLLLTTLAGFDRPTDEEKNFVGTYILPSELFRGMFIEAIYGKEWFQFVCQHPIITTDLDNGDETMYKLVRDLCENVMLYDGKMVANYLCAQIKPGNAEWNQKWMEVVDHYPSEDVLLNVKPLYLEARGNEPLKFKNYLEELAVVDYEFVEEQILTYVSGKLKQEMCKKDEEHFILRAVYLDNPAYELLDDLHDKHPEKAAVTYLKVIKVIDELSQFDRMREVILQESSAFYSYSSSDYYNHHDQIVADYLIYATGLAKSNPDAIRSVVKECLESNRAILYYIGLRIVRDNPDAFKDELMGVLTNKDILEEISGKVSFQIAKLLEAVFPTLDDEEKKAIMTVMSAVAPEWEKTPFPDLLKYQVPLYHIGRRKQELLTQLPKDYLRTEWPDEWRYLQEKERELKKVEVHEPFRIYTKSGWSAHSINSMKAMKVEDMLGAFRKYNTNATGIDEKPTRQGECANFQTIVTQNPEKYVPYIDAILKDSSIHREYAAYGIIGLIKADYDITIIKTLTDNLIKDLSASGLYDQKNLYAVMDLLREMDYYIEKGEVTDVMMEFMCNITKNYPEEPVDNEDLRDRVYDAGINRARGNAAFHLVMCDQLTQYENQIFEALEACEDASAPTKGAIILQQALLNNLNIQRNYELYRKLTKNLTPSLMSIPLNNYHPLLYFINTHYDDLKDFFVKLYDVEASHEMLAQLLWIAWVRKREGADQLLHDLLDRSVKAQLSLIRYFTKEIANMYPAYVKPVTEWVVDSEDEELGKAYEYLVDDFEDRPWEEMVSFVDTYTKGKVFRYASHQFLDFMKEKATMHPDDVLRWMCVYAEVEHKDEQNLFHASTTMGILVSAYNAIRKYDKSNLGLETALDTMDKLMAMESVRRGMRRFLYELDNR